METTTPLRDDTLAPDLWEHPDYVIKRELGRGGMGIVYLAHNTLLGRDEVLKVIGLEIMARPGVIERFLREIRSVARLRHPNIVTAYHATRSARRIVFSMEYVQGLDLARLVKVNGPLPLGHACNFVYQAALGLQHAHEQGLVHRDIKPGNLMLTYCGDKARVKVLDFGLAKATREEKIEEAITSASQTVGTPDFIAPEQVLDAPNVDIRADIYSLGGTLYYLLTGHPPFRANSLYDLYQAHISRDAEPLNLVRPDVSSELAALVARMMAKVPRKRFQTPGEVAHALKGFFNSTDTSSKLENVVSDRGILGVARNEDRPWLDSKPTNQDELALPDSRQDHRPELQIREPIVGAPCHTTSPEPSGRSRRRQSVARDRPHGRPIRVGWATGAVTVLGLAVAIAAMVLMIKTPNGLIVLDNVPEDAVVEVDGNRIQVTPKRGLPVTIVSHEGKHVVAVMRGDEVLMGETVVLDSGKPHKLSVRLEESPVSLPTASPPLIAQHSSEPSSAPEPATPSGDLEGWVPLFNGKDKTNWVEGRGHHGQWSVVDGVLEGRGGDAVGEPAVLLTTRSDYTNFRLRATILNEGQGKRIKVRMKANADMTHTTDGYGVRAGGTRAAIGDYIPLGSINDDEKRNRKDRIEWAVMAVAVHVERDEWYTLEISAIGNRITTSVNGKKAAEFVDETDPFLSGRIALICRARDTIRFKEISIKKLSKDVVPEATTQSSSKSTTE